MTDNSSLFVRFTNEFEKELYRLSKKYRNIKRDVEPIIKQLEEGIFLGAHLMGFGVDNYIYIVSLNRLCKNQKIVKHNIITAIIKVRKVRLCEQLI